MSSVHRSRRTALIVLGFFALVFGLVSFPNHELFRTYALDLGLYTHALWHYAHGGAHDSSLFLDHAQPILSDHFDLYLPVLSPLIYVLGSWTLLIVQWVAVLAGAWGVRRVLIELGSSSLDALLGMAVFLLNFGLFAAMAFDYHSNVVAAMILPWFILMLLRGRMLGSCVLFFAMLLAKENMGFWLGPLAMVLFTMDVIPSRMRRACLVLGPLGMLWSVCVIGWIMPLLSSAGAYAHFDYGILGKDLAHVPSAFIERPIEILRALFMDHRGVSNGTEIKLEFWWMMLASGGWALLVKPKWGLMALPLIAQKMWHDDPGKWSVVAHYGVEFAPLIGIAVPLALARSRSSMVRRTLAGITVMLALGTTVRFMDHTVAYQDRSRIRIYKHEHYSKPYSIEHVRHALDLIPDDAPVSAQSPAVPHLALRDRLYQYPLINDAEYILLLPLESPYPLDVVTYSTRMELLLEDPEWVVLEKSDAVVLFRKSSLRD